MHSPCSNPGCCQTVFNTIILYYLLLFCYGCFSQNLYYLMHASIHRYTSYACLPVCYMPFKMYSPTASRYLVHYMELKQLIKKMNIILLTTKPCLIIVLSQFFILTDIVMQLTVKHHFVVRSYMSSCSYQQKNIVKTGGRIHVV